MKTVCTLVLIFSFVTNLNAQTADLPAGQGTSDDPYQISTLNNLYWIADQTTNKANRFASKFFTQMNNVDASVTSTWFSGAGWLPIGNENNFFKGNYEGNNYEINGLFVNRPTQACNGLFGIVSYAVIKDLGLVNGNITSGDYAGGLVGYSYSFSTITNCYSNGSVTGNGNNTGGLVGIANLNSTIINCYSIGPVTGSGNYIGGLIGNNYTHSSITNCYATGSVSGNGSYKGGLVGNNSSFSTVTDCYSTGSVTGSGAFPGGLVGYNDDKTSTVNNSFWDTQNSGKISSKGGTGKSTLEMKSQATFTNWDFVTTPVWKIAAGKNGGYPYLAWQDILNVLPVSLVSFTAQQIRQEVQLNWSTATEQNTLGFTVQYSTDGTTWNTAGKVNAAGNSNCLIAYKFTHFAPQSGNNYYRLLQTDINNRSVSSNVVKVKFSDIASTVYLMNNPVTNGNLRLQSASAVNIKLFNAQGQLMTEKFLNAGVQTMDVSSYSKGVYFLKTSTETYRLVIK